MDCEGNENNSRICGGRGLEVTIYNGKGNRDEGVIDSNMADGINFEGEGCFIDK